MSLIEEDNLNYLATVEQFFLSLKNSGLTLSAADYHLIAEWEERGVPARLLCRAIERGVANSRERNSGARVSLNYLKEQIDREIERAVS